MSFILRSHHDRYRDRARQSLYRNSSVIFIVILALVIGYFAGHKKSGQESRQLIQQNKELQVMSQDADHTSTQLQADLQTLTIKYNQLANQYKRDVPQGDLGLLTSMVKEQLDKGLGVDRMVQIIRAAQPPRNCSQPQNKRFILSTPAYKGPDSAVTFADGAITVTGAGEPSISNKQEKEAWFDPGKPVALTFTMIGGTKESKKGLLPLHHTIIMRDKEYRFTISEGPRSFIIISSDNCDYMEHSATSGAYSKSLTESSM